MGYRRARDTSMWIHGVGSNVGVLRGDKFIRKCKNLAYHLRSHRFSLHRTQSLYPEAIVRETHRLYPPRGFHEISVPNNTNLFTSIIEANRNPDIWGPDALEWIPEQWLSPLPSSVSDAHVPGIYSHL
ncbi:uncharacterized protein LACBIDRAFT_303213 [Laccaria bicolor S238N-H82]|uniref:Predicted protein n=1 Tax=Laccaria bicolor (strain S238N-H82 / ATCC MYA-4686) TaxID=486041 RepID=B0DJ48_LACBS|nr:uncharacterized protein LACBIDRAFT_303213 [Laccaria bicolor S238N-H82]EDR05341.1 predicted protein [Laccaria bicolor S238N-H82]|eukprot:XP_001883899.1 predicted protein [Laccaria bicolor S238N-H82]